jgi:hypothetical protein
MDSELDKLLEPYKRKATDMFHNDHDDGDTAIYGLIADFKKVLNERDKAAKLSENKQLMANASYDSTTDTYSLRSYYFNRRIAEIEKEVKR